MLLVEVWLQITFTVECEANIHYRLRWCIIFLLVAFEENECTVLHQPGEGGIVHLTAEIDSLRKKERKTFFQLLIFKQKFIIILTHHRIDEASEP